MQSYSPFTKPMNELEACDLEALRQASEGWYIEYKQELPNASAVAKSLSAFANTYGGWLFIGIQEESKENPVAGAFPGIPRNEVDSNLQRMRKSAADHLNPTPHFETVVIWGPEDRIGLPDDRAVICTWIPQSTSAPHIHKSGQIYRRVSDASEPKAENDRFILDQLWQRGEDLKRFHKEWFEREIEFSDHEKSQPFIRLMLTADPWNERDIWINDDNAIRDILRNTEGISTIPFDTVYTSAEGIIGRQLNGNNPQNLTLTWIARRNLTSDIIIPLPLYTPESTKELETTLKYYHYHGDFISVLNKYKTKSPRIIDLNYIFNVLIGVVEIQEKLCASANWNESYHIKSKILNAWRTIPYIDVIDVIDGFESYGPPMCLHSTTSFPPGSGPKKYFEVNRYHEQDSAIVRTLAKALEMFFPIAISYGIPTWISNTGDTESYLTALQDAGVRAINVQKARQNDT